VPYRPIVHRLARASRLTRASRLAAALCAASVIVLAAVSPASASASAAAKLRVNYNFASAFAATFNAPAVSPPGANNFSCVPSAAHRNPVVLVHGTFENMNDNWQAASPILANHGYCVFALNYGGSTPAADFQGTGDIAASAQQLAAFVGKVLSATGAAKVDIVGHSQGGMMPRYYISFLGGAARVGKLIGLAPSNFGTTLDGLTTLTQQLGLAAPINTLLNASCTACVEQEAGSSFLAGLNASPTVPGVTYTAIESVDDEVVTPYTNAFLPAAPNVTNVTVNRQCPLDGTDHLEMAYDPVTMADMLNALDPAQPVKVPCLIVRPIAGPVGIVPSF
jgi:triacylglycerol esterase/lipase EstA (alpha/beta hydrolase family)